MEDGSLGWPSAVASGHTIVIGAGGALRAGNGTNPAGFDGFDGCVPLWSQHGDACPYGSAVHLPFASFTMPSSPSLLTLVACVYSALPFVVVVLNVVIVVCKRRPRELCWLLSTLSTSCANELLRIMFRDPRPASCLTTCGMPSGHSCYAICFFLFVQLWDSMSRVPLTLQHDSRRQTLLTKLGPALLMLPIPWSRVHLGDHSTRQVVFGSLLGAIGAFVWLLCLGPCIEAFLTRILRSCRPSVPAPLSGGLAQPGGPAGAAREAVLDRSLLTPAVELSGGKGDSAATRGERSDSNSSRNSGWQEVGDAI